MKDLCLIIFHHSCLSMRMDKSCLHAARLALELVYLRADFVRELSINTSSSVTNFQ